MLVGVVRGDDVDGQAAKVPAQAVCGSAGCLAGAQCHQACAVAVGGERDGTGCCAELGRAGGTGEYNFQSVVGHGHAL
ncbi:hypothetical protein TPA0906_12320 [Streptomyces olivaceus]|nr:hypothetical protein TPA0906_12320 [Streptomyces olivaceus]